MITVNSLSEMPKETYLMQPKIFITDAEVDAYLERFKERYGEPEAAYRWQPGKNIYVYLKAMKND